MNNKTIIYSGWVILLLGALFTGLFAYSVTFSHNPQVWFTPAYYLQFIPLYISVTLLLCGIFMVTKFSGINFYLAVFGHATSEEILFSMLGFTSTPLPLYAVILFFPLSLLALWVAYSNILIKRKCHWWRQCLALPLVRLLFCCRVLCRH